MRKEWRYSMSICPQSNQERHLSKKKVLLIVLFTPKNALFDAQNGGKMGFLKPNLVGNARQMGEIALKNDLQQS